MIGIYPCLERVRKARMDNRELTRQQAYNILNYAAESVEVGEAIGCHSHRKTFGYHAYKLGTDIVLLQ